MVGRRLRRVSLLVAACAWGCAAHDGDDEPSSGESSIELDSRIRFSPVYSSFDGVHTFAVPVTLRGFEGGPHDVSWDTDRPELVDLERVDDHTVMVTTRGAGSAKIIARAGTLSGSTTLAITRSTPEQWTIGEAIYANGVMPAIDLGPLEGQVKLLEDLSCRNCHTGPEALHVEHTPQQFGGFSDETLTAIVTTGALPIRACCKDGVPRWLLVQMHTWPNPTEEEQRGLVAYLRSIAPVSLGSSIDFGGQ